MSDNVFAKKTNPIFTLRGGRLTKWKGVVASIAPLSAVIISTLVPSNASAAACAVSPMGTYNPGTNGASYTCTISGPTVAATTGAADSTWGLFMFAKTYGSAANPVTGVINVIGDITTTYTGANGITAASGGSSSPANNNSKIDAKNSTINLTMGQLASNKGNAQIGVAASHAAEIDIKTLNLKMENLSSGSYYNYGVVAGSTLDSSEPAAFNGTASRITMENLDLSMKHGASGSSSTLINGLRAIQGATNTNSGSDGQITIKNKLNVVIDGSNASSLTGSLASNARKLVMG